MSNGLHELKKRNFFEMLDLAGRVFIVVRHADNVVIGNRGFLPEEKEKGIVLVFNRMMNFDWSDSGISATLGFGTKTEKCFIPIDNISAIFSPELSAQFIISEENKAKFQPKVIERSKGKPVHSGKSENKVVTVDFKKNK
ncbi:MAG: hypothetical protein HZB33_05050 [Nitrospirae bacterium]|nr:hypothetical protein [Nitrospirota bacterium]